MLDSNDARRYDIYLDESTWRKVLNNVLESASTAKIPPCCAMEPSPLQGDLHSPSPPDHPTVAMATEPAHITTLQPDDEYK